MSSDKEETIIRQCVETINNGNLEVIDQVMDREFFNHAPEAGEGTAPQVVRQLLGDLRAAFPDLKIEVAGFVDEGDTLTFNMTMSGTHTGNLWGAPGTRKYAEWKSTLTTRFSDGKFAFEWRDLAPPNIIAVLREIGLMPPPEDMDKPLKHPVSVPEILLKVLFTGQVADKECAHLEMIQVVEPDRDVCEECVALGDIWPALRMCLICGYVGCCDTSKNKHMKRHYEATGHAIFRSIRLEESWVWCYADNAFFSGKILGRYG